MNNSNNRVCPVRMSGTLDNRIRRWLHNPKKILSPYIREGMTVLDYGCGPGVFTIEMAKLVGKSGHVIACDLQAGMLEKLRSKMLQAELVERITLRKSEEDDIGVREQVDFVLAFYVVHEIKYQTRFFKQIAATTKPKGHLLIVEPLLHVSKAEFEETINEAKQAGFTPVNRPRVFLSKTMLLKREEVEPVDLAVAGAK